MWQFTRKGDGSYKIINCKTGLALDSGGADDNLYTFADCDNAYQSWYIFGSEVSYMLTSQATNGVIDIAGGSPEDGVNAQLYECNGTVAQAFEIIKIDSGANLGLIQDIGSDFYAELGDGRNIFSDSRDGLIIKPEEDSSNQLWHFTRLDDGSYKIINCWSGKDSIQPVTPIIVNLLSAMEQNVTVHLCSHTLRECTLSQENRLWQT